MDGISAAASVLAVIELAAKITSICVEYIRLVKNAKQDISRLLNAVTQLEKIFEHARRICTDSTKTVTVSEIMKTSDECFDQLHKILQKLEITSTRKLATKLKVRELKWPLDSKHIDKELKQIERYEKSLSLALQLDQFSMLEDVGTKLDLSRLPYATGATFDAFTDTELDAKCLEGTRVELLDSIATWIEAKDSKPIFWLNGMAGTGKSTISRTVATTCALKGSLGASFFFKKGEMDRSSTSQLFSTIVVQLIKTIPILKPEVRKCLELDPYIADKAISEQFDKLLYQPLTTVRHHWHSPIVIVIDALDECNSETQVQVLIKLFSRLVLLKPLSIRIFLTSRPEIALREGFEKVDGSYEDIVLHRIEPDVVYNDIYIYLKHELEYIRIQNQLPLDWPNQEQMKTLAKMATPLFIFASTICRFVGDRNQDPELRLQSVLAYQDLGIFDQVHRMYEPILDRLLDKTTKIEQDLILTDFKEVVGTIVTLARPLSIGSLTRLLNTNQRRILRRLKGLHSVLHVADEEPIRVLHLSFVNFLTENQREGSHKFWINTQAMHQHIASQCLDILLNTGCLKKDICELKHPGTQRSKIPIQLVNECLSDEVQYACQYWIYHCKEAKIIDAEKVQQFLEERFLYWFEAMSYLGKAFDLITILDMLYELSTTEPYISILVEDAKRFALRNAEVVDEAPLQLYSSALIFAPVKSLVRGAFKDDLDHWITTLPDVPNHWGASLATLEVGTSIEYPTRLPHCIEFSSDGRLIAFSAGGNIHLWNTATWKLRQTFQLNNSHTSLAFLPDNRHLLATDGNLLNVWDIATGQIVRSIACKAQQLIVKIRSDGRLIVTGSNDGKLNFWTSVFHPNHLSLPLQSSQPYITSSLPTWDYASYSVHSAPIVSLDFSSDEKRLMAVTSQENPLCTIWDLSKSIVERRISRIAFGILDKPSEQETEIKNVRFAPDSKAIITSTITKSSSTTYKRLLSIWNYNDLKKINGNNSDLTNNIDGDGSDSTNTVQLCSRHTDCLSYYPTSAMALSRDGKLFACGWNKNIKLWDMSGAQEQTIADAHSHSVQYLQFSPDGKILLSSSFDSTVKVWNVTELMWNFKEDSLTLLTKPNFNPRFLKSRPVFVSDYDRQLANTITAIKFSNNGVWLAFATLDKTITMFKILIVGLRPCGPSQILQGNTVVALTFSPDTKILVSAGSGPILKIWLLKDGSWECAQEIEENAPGQHRVHATSFSNDGSLLATASSHVMGIVHSSKITIYETISEKWAVKTTFDSTSQSLYEPHLLSFSPNKSLLAAVDRMVIDVWDIGSGNRRHWFKTPDIIEKVSFHPTGMFLQTNLGLYDFNGNFSGPSSSDYSHAWIMRNGEKIIWIPKRYRLAGDPHHKRPMYLAYDRYEDLVALGTASGAITLIGLSSSQLQDISQGKLVKPSSEHSQALPMRLYY